MRLLGKSVETSVKDQAPLCLSAGLRSGIIARDEAAKALVAAKPEGAVPVAIRYAKSSRDHSVRCGQAAQLQGRLLLRVQTVHRSRAGGVDPTLQVLGQGRNGIARHAPGAGVGCKGRRPGLKVVHSKQAFAPCSHPQAAAAIHQQGTYAPDRFYRWLASPAMDRAGNIGIGYSFGGTPHFAGQRFAGRRASDPPGALTLQETVLVEGEGSQDAVRWEDYSQTAVDPSDDCTIWYVGDYLRKGVETYSSKIGGFRMAGCGS